LNKLKAYQQRLVGILKALVFSARVLILDEPTAALPLEEREILLSRILQLRDEGYTILYVSHHLDEIEKVADAIAALKDGKLVGSRETIPGQGEMIEMMTGAKLDCIGDLYRPEPGLREHAVPHATGAIRQFDVEWEPDSGRPDLFREPLSLSFASGEITLLTGLVGSGVKDLAEALFGFQRNCRVRCTSDGVSFMIDSPNSAIRKSIGYLSDDRIGEAVLPDFSIRNNMTLPKLQKVAGLLGRILLKQETRAAQELSDRLNVKMRSLKQNILELSGGNQQKVMLARWLFSEVRFLILNEPTQGIDVMAKKEVMDLLFSFVSGGGSCVIATTDPEEFLPSANRVVVLRKGKITGDFSGSAIQRDAVFTAMLIQQ
jgi:ribose transport system ATP-binding protein